jgi:hypothetical protein
MKREDDGMLTQDPPQQQQHLPAREHNNAENRHGT